MMNNNFHLEPVSNFEIYTIPEKKPLWINHTLSWARIIENTFKHMKGYYIADSKRIDRNTSFLPIYEIKRPLNKKIWLSIPYATICDPIVSSSNKYDELLSGIVTHQKNQNCSIEIRSIYGNPCKHAFQIRSNYLNHILHLEDDLKTVFKRFHKKSVQVLIQKSLDCGTTLVVGKTKADVEIFYNLYVNSRRELGLPPQPYRFFVNMWNELNTTGNLELLLAQNAGKNIAALWILKNNWLSSFEYLGQSQRKDCYHSAHFLYWNAIQRAIESGIKTVSFARTSSNNTTLNKFKQNWGTISMPYTDYHYPHANKKSRENNILYTIIRKSSTILPTSVFRLMGELIYRFL